MEEITEHNTKMLMEYHEAEEGLVPEPENFDMKLFKK